jgi:wobble nucleotide-excising tRNase
MIDSLSIDQVASYRSSAQVLLNLKPINYIYGANGAGKTTISRLLADEESYHTCRVGWINGVKLRTMVYNRDYVDRNFTQPDSLKGIFTLGEGHIEVQSRITILTSEIEQLQEDVKQLKGTLEGEDGDSGKKAELLALENELKETCWKQKQTHEGHFKDAFKGFMTKELFKEQVLAQHANNTSTDEALDVLKSRSEIIFGSAPTMIPLHVPLATTDLIAAESEGVLLKSVVGKEDVDIATLIHKLDNSDWIKQGRDYFDETTRVCPFCQQVAMETLSASLNEYFDESFTTDTKAIDAIIRQYATAAEALRNNLVTASSTMCKYLDRDLFKAEADLLLERVANNQKILSEKKKEPSRKITLSSIEDLSSSVGNMIDTANQEIRRHNSAITNLPTEKRTLTAQIWKYIVAIELKDAITDHSRKKTGLLAAINSLERQISEKQQACRLKVIELKGLERQVITIRPTIDGINALLVAYGFRSFKLDTTTDGKAYRLVRENGEDAKATLSEGEKTFITFLYFYHFLKGSDSESEVTDNRVVVIDDPVSSLDSDVLTIVSGLIRSIFAEIRAGSTAIRQIFVLTHNVYFHKQITFHKNRSAGTRFCEETFWLVRKCDGKNSVIEYHERNPVSTTYEMLWEEVRNPTRNIRTMQNTLRRILEYYFRVFGGFNDEKLIAQLEPADRMAATSLFSWAHEGSHYAGDDLHIAMDHEQVDKYLDVFKKIFEKNGHGEHYCMMARTKSE